MQSSGNHCQFFHKMGIKCTPARIIKLEDDHFEWMAMIQTEEVCYNQRKDDSGIVC
jgi:hypothetical protein